MKCGQKEDDEIGERKERKTIFRIKKNLYKKITRRNVCVCVFLGRDVYKGGGYKKDVHVRHIAQFHPVTQQESKRGGQKKENEEKEPKVPRFV